MMKDRDLKKLDKEFQKACQQMQKPQRDVFFIRNDFVKVLARCGSAPFEGCEDIAAKTMAVLSLLLLAIAEEHLTVEFFENDYLPKSEDLSGASWPGLADQAMELAHQARGLRTVGAGSPELRNLLEEVIQRAQTVKGEEAGWEGKVVKKKSQGGGMVYVPAGWDARAWFATSLSTLRRDDVVKHLRSYANGQWLMTTMGFIG